MPKRKAVFLDRDGTVIEDMHYSVDAAKLQFLPGAIEAIKRFNQAGYLVVIITNQSGVARGLFSEDELKEFHQTFLQFARQRGAQINAIYYCPHHPQGEVPIYRLDCRSRKPKPGLLLRAAEDLDIELGASFAIGDSERDVEAGRRAGCQTIFIKSDRGADVASDFTVTSLLEAAEEVLKNRTQAAEEKPSRPVHTCAVCGREISDEELAAGQAVEKEGKYFCSECITKGKEPPEEPSGTPRLQETLRQMQIDLKNLVTHLTYERFSIWNVVAGIAQGGALFAMFLGFQARGNYDKSHLMLLWAILAQLLALTCFLKAK